MKIRLVRSILLGLVILCSATNLAARSDASNGGNYTAKDKEYYLTDEQIAFIRPGLVITILDVVLPSDGQLEVTYSITDPAGLPLDHDGIATPGPVDMRFTLANIPADQDKKVRLAYERIDRGNGTLTSMGDGVYKYKFETAVSTDPDTTHTLVLGGRRDLQEFELDRYAANAVKNWVPSGMFDPTPRDVVRVESCNRCHNPLMEHGRWLSVTACEQCHNPGLVDDGQSFSFDVFIHQLHVGDLVVGRHDFTDVEFPATFNGIPDCEVCHTGGVPTDDRPLVATPNPVPVCDASGLGVTDLTWGDLSPFEIHVNAVDGPLFGISKGAGTKATGKWVRDGTRFFLVDRASGVLVENLQVDTTALGCVGEQPGIYRGVAGTQGSYWMTRPSRAACGSCHKSVNFVTGEHHPGGPQIDDSLCGFCHQPAPTGTKEFDASVSGAHKPEYKSRQLPGVIVEIMSVANTDPGDRPTVTFSLKSKNAMLNPASLNRMRLAITGPNDDFSFYAQETVGSKAVKNGDNWDYTFATPLPWNATGSYTVGFEARNMIDIEGREGIEEVEDQAQNATFAFAVTDPAAEPRLLRAPVQSRAIPPEGLEDDLASEGLYLVSIGCAPSGPENSLQPCIELPGFADVELFADFVQCVAIAATAAGLTHLVWRGFPPPVDASVAWITLTPDPAVLEVNEAPAASIAGFLDMSRRLFDVVQSSGLAPYRLNYNGDISESGGGGQFTLGGPSAERSPFFVAPHLLSRLILYLNHHPSLSYWFAPVYVGSYSQSPRTDENVLESFSELQVALQQLAASSAPAPEFIWRSLSPFLVDTSGNAHRSEINIEKLWNPYLPGRGCLGLVEFRAFRMMMDAQSAAAIAVMLRALAAMLARQEPHHALIEWGSRLHDRFALPFYLLQDLHTVFDDLECAGLGLGEPITRRLCADNWRHVGDAELAGCRLDVDLAIEFWPLLGDAAEQAGGSRLVDASTKRLQLTLRSSGEQDTDLDGWRLLAGNFLVPLRREQDDAGEVLITGLRYRAFVPWAGLHPGLGAQSPIVLWLLPPAGENGLRCTLHDWQPEGKAYDGLPVHLDEARRRIAERFVVEEILPEQVPDAVNPPDEAVSDYCLDLRRT